MANAKTQEIFVSRKIREHEVFQTRGNSKISLTLKADAPIESRRIFAAIQRFRRRRRAFLSQSRDGGDRSRGQFAARLIRSRAGRNPIRRDW